MYRIKYNVKAFSKVLSLLYKTKLKEFHLILMAFILGGLIILLGFLNNHLSSTHKSQIDVLQRVNLKLSYAHIWLDEFITSENRSIGSSNPTEQNLLKARQDIQLLLNYKESLPLFKLFDETLQEQLKRILNHINKINISANVCINTRVSTGSVPDIYNNHETEFNSLKKNIDYTYNKLTLRLNSIINTVRLSQYILLTILLAHIILAVLVIKNIRLKLLEREIRLKTVQNIAKLGFYSYNFNTGKWTISKIILELIGYPKDNNIYKSWLSIIHPDDKIFVMDTIKKIREPLDLIYRIYNKNNDDVWWIHHVSNPIKKDSKTRNLTILGTIQNITEKRKLESDFLHAFIDAQEQEKQSFGEDLHDGISQILAAEAMYIDVLMRLDKKDDNKITEFLSKIRDLNLKATNDARNIAHGLMSKQLKEEGLLKAVAQVCIDYSQSRSINFSFEQEGLKEVDFTKEIKINIFRIIQEISTNIIRHSGAKNAIINMAKTKQNQLELIVKDNGVGIDFDKMKRDNKGTGLKNIERRVTLLDGKLNLESALNKGACYTILVPLKSQY